MGDGGWDPPCSNVLPYLLAMDWFREVQITFNPISIGLLIGLKRQLFLFFSVE